MFTQHRKITVPEMPLPTKQPLHIPDEILHAIYRQARDEFPNECCGWLTGPKDGDAVTTRRPAVNAYQPGAHPTANDRTAERAYVITGEDLMELYNTLDSANPPRVIYHSHPNGRAYFSETDQSIAASPWGDGPAYPVQQLVVGIDGRRVVEARLFAWDDKAGEYVEIEKLPGAEI
jgi:proteasome lid subunit RPN8/RPN11